MGVKRWNIIFMLLLGSIIFAFFQPIVVLQAKEKGNKEENYEIYVGNELRIPKTDGEAIRFFAKENVECYYYEEETEFVIIAKSTGVINFEIYRREDSKNQEKEKTIIDKKGSITVKRSPYFIKKNTAPVFTNEEYLVTLAGISSTELDRVENREENPVNKQGESIKDVIFSVRNEYGMELRGIEVTGMQEEEIYDIRADYSVERRKNKFVFQFYEKGTYFIYVQVTTIKDGTEIQYKDSRKISVETLGFKKSNFAVAVGCSRPTEVENYTKITGYQSEDESIVKIDKKGVVKGIAVGKTRISVTGITIKGEEKTTFCNIAVTDPVLVETPPKIITIDEEYRSVRFQGIEWYSSVTITSSNSDILGTEGEGFTSFSNYYIGLSAGTAKLTIEVDGKQLYSKNIRVYDPKLPKYILMTVGKTNTDLTKLKLPQKESKTEFKTSDRSIVRVDKTGGRLRAAAEGSIDLTVKIDEFSYHVTVIAVENKKVRDAMQYVFDAMGKPYSQEKRMQEGYYDCSSLVWRAYKAAGVGIGGSTTYAPTAANLAKNLIENGHEVKKAEDLKPGDLIFYGGGGNDRYRSISHVALVVNKSKATGWFGEEWYLTLADAGTEGVRLSRDYVSLEMDESFIAARPIK